MLGVVGEDRIGAEILDQAGADGVDITAVVHRPGACTGLIVDVVDAGGRWRYLEHLPSEVLVSAPDVHAAAAMLGASRLERSLFVCQNRQILSVLAHKQ